MKKQTIQLTTGALMVAIFGMILLLDRQTGRMFESVFLIIFPVPMVVYTTKYGWKAGVPVFIAMSLISIIFASPMMIFYGVTQALVGLIFGAQVQRRANMTQTLFVVILLTVVFTIMDFFVLSALMGNDILTYIDDNMPEMQEMMRNVLQRYDSERAEQVIAFMTADVLKEVMVIVVVIEGAVQGFLEFEISLLLMNRLRMPVAKPKSLFLYYPPLWFGYLLIAVFGVYFLGYYYISNSQIKMAVQALGFCASYTLAFFGFLCVCLWVRTKMPKNRWLGPLLGFACFTLYAFALDVFGVIYLITGWHERWVTQLEEAGVDISGKNSTLQPTAAGRNETVEGRSAYSAIAERGSDKKAEDTFPEKNEGNSGRGSFAKTGRSAGPGRGIPEKSSRRSITDIARMMENSKTPDPESKKAADAGDEDN